MLTVVEHLAGTCLLHARPTIVHCSSETLACAHQVTSDSSYKEWEQMRITLEPLAYKYGVDLFYNGALLLRSCSTALVCMQCPCN